MNAAAVAIVDLGGARPICMTLPTTAPMPPTVAPIAPAASIDRKPIDCVRGLPSFERRKKSLEILQLYSNTIPTYKIHTPRAYSEY